MVVDTESPQDVKTLALVTLSQAYIDKGEHALARAVLAQAVAQLPQDPQFQAAIFTYIGYINQLSRPANLDDAITWYSRALGIAEIPTAYLNRGVAYLRQNKPADWARDLAHVLALQPANPTAQEALCWAHGLDEHPDLALPYCDAAVKAQTDGFNRQARAMVYAGLRRLPEAAAEMQDFMGWLGQQQDSLRARYGSKCDEWLQVLNSGQNPFDQNVLDELRKQ
jgi:tetratricopeptide (TPR) repeat protein